MDTNGKEGQDGQVAVLDPKNKGGEPAKKNEPELIAKERLDSVLADNKLLKAQLQSMQDNLEIMRANMPAPQRVDQPKKGMFDDIFEGDESEGFVEPKQLKAFGERILGHIQNLANQFSVQQQNPDFQKIISEHFPAIAKEDPTAYQQVRELYKVNPGLAAATAYRLAKTSSTYLEQKNKDEQSRKDQELTEQQIKKLLESRDMPQSVSAAGSGGGSGGSSGSPLFDKMMSIESDEEFAKFSDDLKSGKVKMSGP